MAYVSHLEVLDAAKQLAAAGLQGYMAQGHAYADAIDMTRRNMPKIIDLAEEVVGGVEKRFNGAAQKPFP